MSKVIISKGEQRVKMDTRFVHNYVRGHRVKKVEDDLFYVEDDVRLRDDPRRACKHCGKKPTEDDCDPCLGKLPGVVSACCGHGVEKGYITFDDGTTVRFLLASVEKNGKHVMKLPIKYPRPEPRSHEEVASILADGVLIEDCE